MQGSAGVNQAATYGTKKVASISNSPGSRRYHNSKILITNNAFLFGGQSYGGGYLNDVWSYNVLDMLRLHGWMY